MTRIYRLQFYVPEPFYLFIWTHNGERHEIGTSGNDYYHNVSEL